MKKILFTCFLGYLCPPKSKFKSNWLVDILCSIKTLFPRLWRDIFIPKFRDYLTKGISPLIGGLFYRRSRSISGQSKNYLSDKGAVFRQPQADISQKRSDFISQAEGLCISNFLNQKWFVKTFLILSILLSSINEVSSQVTDSPGGDLLHRSSTHRSGETRSEPFFSVTAQDIDGGPSLPSTRLGGSFSIKLDKDSDDIFQTSIDCGPSTVDCKTKGFSLVDDSISLGQEGAIPSAPSGALIYGELINPDSLSPLNLLLTEHKLGYRNTAGESEILIDPKPGKFLDGVLSSVRKKFRLRLPQDKAMYASLRLDNKVLLEDYILFPTDSVMISLDLRSMEVVFGGPDRDWMDAQYAIKRGEASNTFYSRRLMEQDKEGFLDTDHNRADWYRYQQEFGPRLNIVELGRDGADQSYSKMMNTDYVSIPGWKELQRYKADLTLMQYDLLEADLIGNYFGQELRSFLQYQYGVPKMKGQQELLDRMDTMLPHLAAKLKNDIDALAPSTFSQGYNELITLWIKLMQMGSVDSFESIAQKYFKGEVLDRLLASNLMYRVRFTSGQLDQWEDYMDLIQSPEWRILAGDALDKYRTGQPVEEVVFKGLDGKVWRLEDFQGVPTLFYFYFSTCSNSEKYFRKYLWPLYQETADQQAYRLVAVSVDDDTALWETNIPTYSRPELLNLNLPLASNKDWLEQYHIDAYPRGLLIDADGHLLSYNLQGIDYTDYRDRFIKLLEKAEKNSKP